MPAEISTAGACGSSSSGPSMQACRSSPAAQLRSVMRKTPAGQARVENFEFDRKRHGPFSRWPVPLTRPPPLPIRDAIRSASRAATSGLVIAGQSSTPSPSTRWIVLLSPPKVPVPGDTSLARIQSQPLRRRFSSALATTFSVSAAKPMTRAGRSLRAGRDASRGCPGSRRGAASAAPCRPFSVSGRPRSRPASRRRRPP